MTAGFHEVRFPLRLALGTSGGPVTFINAAGDDICPEDQRELSDWITTIITVAGGLLALYGRLSMSRRLS